MHDWATGIQKTSRKRHPSMTGDIFPNNGFERKGRDFADTEGALEQPARQEEPTMSQCAASATVYTLACLVDRRTSGKDGTCMHLDVEAFLSRTIDGGRRTLSSKITSNPNS